MTERLYYDDAYLWQFDAVVTSVKNGKRPGEWEVMLDRSAFYPTSGGQPFDTGVLGFGKVKAKVTDVEVDAAGEVVHTVDKEIPAGTAVRVREARGEWIRVLLPDGASGWIPAPR